MTSSSGRPSSSFNGSTTTTPGGPRGQVLVTDHLVGGPHGDLRLRVYEPAPAAARVAGLVWCHGGAFMRGDLEMAEPDWVARELARRGVVVASVEYRLAPEFDYRAGEVPTELQPGRVHFPVPSEEVTCAFGWTPGVVGHDMPSTAGAPTETTPDESPQHTRKQS